MDSEDRQARQVSVPCDYDTDPERYRLGMRTARAHTGADLYGRVARLLGELGAGTVLDVGCADGALRAALPAPGPWLVGLDASETLLRDHPPPVLRADARRLPVRDRAVDAVTALNVLYHLPDPMPALREAHRVLRAGGHLLAATIARTDSPEFSAYWTRSATSFDAEDAPGLLARVFESIAVSLLGRAAGDASRRGGDPRPPGRPAGACRGRRRGGRGGAPAPAGHQARRPDRGRPRSVAAAPCRPCGPRRRGVPEGGQEGVRRRA